MTAINSNISSGDAALVIASSDNSLNRVKPNYNNIDSGKSTPFSATLNQQLAKGSEREDRPSSTAAGSHDAQSAKLRNAETAGYDKSSRENQPASEHSIEPLVAEVESDSESLEELLNSITLEIPASDTGQDDSKSLLLTGNDGDEDINYLSETQIYPLAEHFEDQSIAVGVSAQNLPLAIQGGNVVSALSATANTMQSDKSQPVSLPSANSVLMNASSPVTAAVNPSEQQSKSIEVAISASGNIKSEVEKPQDSQLIARMNLVGAIGYDGDERAAGVDQSYKQSSYSDFHQSAKIQQAYLQTNGERDGANSFFNAMQATLREHTLQTSLPIKNSVGLDLNAVAATLTLGESSTQGDAQASAMPINKLDLPLETVSPNLRVLNPIGDRLGQQQWQQEVSQRVNVMLNHQINSAHVQLHPKHFGAMEISVSIDKDHKVSVNFQVQHQQVKDALDSAMPKLREMLQSQGFNLTHSDISYRQHKGDGQEYTSGQHPKLSAYQERFSEEAEPNSIQRITLTHSSSSRLDLFV